MNKDFHYYGTYVAARLAGYNFDEAQIVAYAAQYVDDSVSSMLDRRYLKGLKPIPTSQTLKEISDNNGLLTWNENFLNQTARIWPVFHFLPGNLEGKEVYDGPMSDSGPSYNWDFDDESKEQFRLMCLPNSPILVNMINNKSTSETLQGIGIKMHVLADSWAHKYFAGIPAWFINQTYNYENKTAKFKNPISVPDLLAYNSLMYLGHGSAGHWPDLPYMKYSYTPRWTKEKLIDNPADYLLAFRQMVKVLYSIKGDNNYNAYDYEVLSPKTETILIQILNTQKDDQSDTWKKYISDIEFEGKGLDVPFDYDSHFWLEKAKRETEENMNTTDYYHFNAAAINHFNYINEQLQNAGIFLGKFSNDRIVKCHIKASSGQYISASENYLGTPYPTLGKTPMVHELILSTEKLVVGSNIRIRTTEIKGSMKDHVYLGAWSDSHYLYYFTKDYNLFDQKWSIVQGDKPVGTEIDFNQPVAIKNQAFKNQPFMAPDGSSLTTHKNSYTFTLIKV